MKAIKITASNAAAIHAALKAVNGTAIQHAYTEFYELNSLALQAEAKLAQFLNVKDRAGAAWTETSGAKVDKSYKNPRTATRVRLERKSGGWYLVGATKVTINEAGGGAGILTLTKAQDEAARAKFATQYSVAA